MLYVSVLMLVCISTFRVTALMLVCINTFRVSQCYFNEQKNKKVLNGTAEAGDWIDGGYKKTKNPGLLWPNFSILDLLESPRCSEKQAKSV